VDRKQNTARLQSITRLGEEQLKYWISLSRLEKDFGEDLINIKAIGEGNFGKTPIFYALTRSREEMVNHCLDLGADLLIVNNKGQTPCSLAASHLSEQLRHKMSRIEEEQLRSGRAFQNFRLSNSDGFKYGDLDPRFPIDDANMDHDIRDALR
jgi:hypothetical protein